jgi:hypothetical protein
MTGYFVLEKNGFNWTIIDYWCTKSITYSWLPPKYEIIMVPSNHSFFQFCDSNIELFSIALCNVITLNPLSILVGISSLLLF